MAFDGGEIRLDPTVVHLDDLLDDIAQGKVRVPDFQRPFVWRPEQMIELFDSIERGFPIGSLLLWQTDKPVPTSTQIGEIEVPTLPPGTQVSYVLDGHQRLSTLFGVLRRPGPAPRPDNPREWKWWIYRDLREWRYRPLREQAGSDRYRQYSGALATAHYLPLRAVSKTLDFLHFSRAMDERRLERSGEMIRTAETVAQRIKGYKLTLIQLRGADLDQAVEVYTRLNRKGTRMDADQMVSALTYRHPDRPPLANRIDEIVTSVAETGFGDVPRMAVFRTVLAVAGEEDVMSPRWEAVAGRLQDRMHQAVPPSEQAVNLAVDFLRAEVKLPLAKLLPYAHQLTLLAVFFHRRPQPTEAQRYELRRWFWITSWASSFAGANSTMVRRALQEMEEFANHGSGLKLDLDAVQPMPDEFNMNSARTRAYVIWELREMPIRRDALGQQFDPVKLLASADSTVHRQVVPRDKRPANRLLLPTRPNQTVLDALTGLTPPARDILASHLIPTKSWHRLVEGNGKLFVDDRTEELTARLRRFANEIKVPLGDVLVGIADEDTE